MNVNHVVLVALLIGLVIAISDAKAGTFPCGVKFKTCLGVRPNYETEKRCLDEYAQCKKTCIN